MKKLISVILGLALILGSVPTAFAAGGTPVSDMDALTAAIEDAMPGDVITLEPGVYAPDGGVLTINKAVSLAGSGSGVEFNGAIVYDLADAVRGSRVELRRLNINAVAGMECGAALTSGRGWVLAIDGCTFTGWKYGAAVYPDCRSCKLDVYNSSFACFTAVSISDSYGNGVQRLDAKNSGLYEYHRYRDAQGGYYYDYDSCAGESVMLANADYVPSGAVTASWPAAARIGDTFYESLDAALKAAQSGDTVHALLSEERTDAPSVTVKSGVTLEVRQGTDIFEAIVNNGTLRNGGVIRGGVAGSGETLTLVRAEPEPSSLDVRVTDKSGREYQPDGGTLDYYLPAGDYTLEFSGDGWYTAMVNVSVSPERYQIVRQQASPRLSFSDVSSSDWFYEYVFAVYERGLMQGVTETSFAPGGTVTRAMAATILYRLAGEPDMPDSNWGYPYADVDPASWYATAVYWARLNGIVNGTGDDTFSPDSPVTREQLAAMLYRYAEHAGLDTGDGGGLSGFSDSADISSWARAAAAWAAENGIVTGTDGGRFDPQGRATRAQLAAIICRFDAG